MTAPERAPLGAALALLLTVITLTGHLSPLLMAIAVALVGLMVGLAWPALLELPSPLGTRIVVSAAGAASALITVLAPERISPVTGILIVCAGGVLASFIHQMCRPVRDGLTASLTGTVAGVFVTSLGASWVIAQSQAQVEGMSWLVTAVAAGLAATLLIDATPLPTVVRFVLAVLAGAGTCLALTTQLGGLDLLPGVVLGLVVAVGASCTHLLLGSTLVSRRPGPTLAVAAGPVATVGVVALLAVTLLV